MAASSAFSKSAGHRHRRAGTVLIYGVVLFSVLTGFVSLGVDYGHVQLTKNELETATLAAARYGAAGLPNGSAAATANAIAAAAQNTADGTPVVLLTTDIQFGTWDASTRTFTQVFGAAQDTATAIRISTARSAARGNGVALGFGQILGQQTCDVTASAIASVSYGTSVTSSVPATSNPWLSGMPAGTISNPGNPHNDPDYAGTASNPLESPVAFSGLNISPGQTITFDSVSGGANNDPNGGLYGPDGNINWITNMLTAPEHGMSNINAPINAVIGVFLSNTEPDLNTAPASLDFSSDAERNFTSLSPQLQQVFFIGDGRRDSGEVQQFVVPPGATRLFIGTMDQYEWSNNVGAYSVEAHNAPVVTLVQ